MPPRRRFKQFFCGTKEFLVSLLLFGIYAGGAAGRVFGPGAARERCQLINYRVQADCRAPPSVAGEAGRGTGRGAGQGGARDGAGRGGVRLVTEIINQGLEIVAYFYLNFPISATAGHQCCCSVPTAGPATITLHCNTTDRQLTWAVCAMSAAGRCRPKEMASKQPV